MEFIEGMREKKSVDLQRFLSGGGRDFACV